MNQQINVRRLFGVAALAAGVIVGAGPLAIDAANHPGAATDGLGPEVGINRGYIQIPAGETSTSVTGTVARGDWQHWGAWARAGQTMELTVTANATFELYSPSGDQLANDVTSTSITLPATGGYAIDVGSVGDVADYTLTLTITSEPSNGDGDAGEARRIEFAPGTNSAAAQGDILPATADRYVLWAAAGQEMSLDLTSVTSNISFSLYAPDGTKLIDDETLANAVLPANGDYLVVVETTSSGGPYTIAFVIA